MTSTEASPQELHLLYVLLDSNLPTGGFVSSSGLESYAKHGFLHPSPDYTTPLFPTSSTSSSSHQNGESRPRAAGPSSVALSPARTAQAVVEFARGEVGTYALSTLGFVRDSWDVVTSYLEGQTSMDYPDGSDENQALQAIIQQITDLDDYHEANLLSHVSRRSSKAQGIAMLTLYGRGLSKPPGMVDDLMGILEGDIEMERCKRREERAKEVVDEYKRLVRKGVVPGHLAVCWGVMTAAMALSLDRASHLHLFLHARSLLSSAVRLNLIGPYASSQLLLHPFRKIIDAELKKVGHLTTGLLVHTPEVNGEDDFWAWTDKADMGAGTSWPLGEVLMGRHDLQHSRIFNS